MCLVRHLLPRCHAMEASGRESEAKRQAETEISKTQRGRERRKRALHCYVPPRPGQLILGDEANGESDIAQCGIIAFGKSEIPQGDGSNSSPPSLASLSSHLSAPRVASKSCSLTPPSNSPARISSTELSLSRSASLAQSGASFVTGIWCAADGGPLHRRWIPVCVRHALTSTYLELRSKK